MPDLTIQYYWECVSVESWQTKIVGSKGDVYTIRRNPRSELEFTCDCPAGTYEKLCKHVKEAKQSWCGWMQFISGGEPEVVGDEKFCPKCGDGAISRGWGV